jgi:O-antigen ligase
MSRTVVVLAVAVLIFRPGVWDTIHGRIEDTKNVNSFKGQTYQYRWELWGIAWKKISPDPMRTLFGFGPGATEHMAIETVLSYTGEVGKLWSWDNHYAATLVEGGLTGLGLLFLLYGTTIYGQWKLLRRAKGNNRTILAAILSGMLGLVFMMSNVAIFAPQLNYLYWTLTASGLAIGTMPDVNIPLKSEVIYARQT